MHKHVIKLEQPLNVVLHRESFDEDGYGAKSGFQRTIERSIPEGGISD